MCKGLSSMTERRINSMLRGVREGGSGMQVGQTVPGLDLEG